MRASQIVPGVHLVLGGFVHAYAIESDDGLVLVDCGIDKSPDAIDAAIGAMGRTMREVYHILVTHHHADHAGGLAELAKRAEAKVYVHAVDAPIVRGDAEPPKPEWTGWFARLVGPRMGPPAAPRPTPVDVEPADGDVLPLAGGIRVLHTPGHTMGHVSFLVEREPRTLVVGDAAINVAGLRPSAGRLGELVTYDPQAALRSFETLAGLDFQAAVFGHGKPIPTGAADRFRRTAARWRKFLA